ncbi:MAG: ribonuclease HII, partial [Candidatus Andersenbacteria bacterium]
QGIEIVAGIDEVGMGAFAGPVVAAAVILTPDTSIPGIRDSKLLSPTRRVSVSALIQQHAVSFAIGEASVEEITALNIRGASHLAMARAVTALSVTPELLLIDGTPAQIHPTIPAITIIDGDTLSLSIAAASIVAKVYRDTLMQRLHNEFPQYGFSGNKGYGSLAHKQALIEHGPCPHHRPSYAPIAALTKT